jgi:hypothetical protein
LCGLSLKLRPKWQSDVGRSESHGNGDQVKNETQTSAAR